MGRFGRAKGITLVEVMVVMVLIAILSGIVGPAIARRFENLSLQTNATQLAAQFRRAQAQARITQAPIAATYSDHAFHFLSGTKEIGSFPLASSIRPIFENGLDTFLLLPSGQIAGPEHLQLLNQNGRKAVIEMSFLNGIAVQGTR
jgi:prepilin-type N-terminal cleavage/methylation domain-containing protein